MYFFNNNFLDLITISGSEEFLLKSVLYTEKKKVNFNKYLVQYCQLNTLLTINKF